MVLFDGVCNLCNASVGWIIRRDRRGVFRFASLQSEFARRALAEAAGRPGAGGSPPPLPDSIVLLTGGRVLTRSSAVIGIARRLGMPWSMAAVGLVMPRPIRDAIYAFIARRRYRWFGKREACAVPTPALRARFLDASPPVAGRAGVSGVEEPASSGG